MLELSKDGIEFLVMLWKQYEETKMASIYILERIFSTIEGGCPFLATEIAIIENGKITLSTWIDIWQMLIHNNPQQAFKYALYLGYNKSLKSFIEVIKASSWSIFGVKDRSVFKCVIIQREPRFLNALIGPSLETTRSAVITLDDNKTLIMSEVGEDWIAKLNEFDLCLFIHDGTSASADFIKVNCRKVRLPKAIVDISEEVNVAVPIERIVKSIRGRLIPKAKVSLDSKSQAMQTINRLVKIL